MFCVPGNAFKSPRLIAFSLGYFEVPWMRTRCGMAFCALKDHFSPGIDSRQRLGAAGHHVHGEPMEGREDALRCAWRDVAHVDVVERWARVVCSEWRG